MLDILLVIDKRLIEKSLLKLKNREEQDLLLNKIFSCKEPNYSPDNKRIVYKINIENINSKFH